jgi:hypothetical protein
VRRPGIVILDPAAEVREDGLGIPELRTIDVVAFERLDEGLGQAIAAGYTPAS